MNAEMLVLRLLHIFAGVFWAGSVFYQVYFIFPAVHALGQEGGKFMQQLARTKNMPTRMSILGLINVLTGLRMIQILSANFQSAWFETNFGMAISIGSIAALGALTIGIGFNKPTANKMALISKAISESGTPPSSNQIEELTKLKNKLEKGVKIMAWHLLVAVILMATARYL